MNKKIVSLVLALAMVLSMASFAFADQYTYYDIEYYALVPTWVETEEGIYVQQDSWEKLDESQLDYAQMRYPSEIGVEYLYTDYSSYGENFIGWVSTYPAFATEDDFVYSIPAGTTGTIKLYAYMVGAPQIVYSTPWQAASDSAIELSVHFCLDEDAQQAYDAFSGAGVDVSLQYILSGKNTFKLDEIPAVYDPDEGIFKADGFVSIAAAAAPAEAFGVATVTREINGIEISSTSDLFTIYVATKGAVGLKGASLEPVFNLQDLNNCENGESIYLLQDVDFNGDFEDNYLYAEDLKIYAQGHSVKNLELFESATLINPGKDNSVNIEIGYYEEGDMGAQPVLYVEGSNGDEHFDVNLSYSSEAGVIDIEGGYPILSGVSANNVSINRSGYTAAELGGKVTFVKTTELPFAIITGTQWEEGSDERITDFQFFRTLMEAEDVLASISEYREEKYNSIYVLNYINKTNPELSRHEYNALYAPTFDVKTLYRVTDGETSSFYIHSPGALTYNPEDFMLQYSNGAEVEFDANCSTEAAVLNCFYGDTITGEAVLVNNWNKVALTQADKNVTVTAPGAYYITGGAVADGCVTIDGCGKFTVVVEGADLVVNNSKATPCSISISGENTGHNLTVNGNVYSRVGTNHDYMANTEFAKVVNNGVQMEAGGREYWYGSSTYTIFQQLVNKGYFYGSEGFEVYAYHAADGQNSFTAVTNEGNMELDSVIVHTQSSNNKKAIGIDNTGNLELNGTTVYLLNYGESEGYGIRNTGDIYFSDSNDFGNDVIVVLQGYGIYGIRDSEYCPCLDIKALTVIVDGESYNGNCAGIKTVGDNEVFFTPGGKTYQFGKRPRAVTINAGNSSKGVGLDLSEGTHWEFQGTQDSIFVIGGKAAVIAPYETCPYGEHPITTGIYVGGFELLEGPQLASGKTPQLEDLMPGKNFYIDRTVTYNYNGFDRQAMRVVNAEYELLDYLDEGGFKNYTFVLPCDIELGDPLADWDYTKMPEPRSIVIDKDRTIDFNGFDITVDERVDLYELFYMGDGCLEFINSSEEESSISGNGNINYLVEINRLVNYEAPAFINRGVNMHDAENSCIDASGNAQLFAGTYDGRIIFYDGNSTIHGGTYLQGIEDRTNGTPADSLKISGGAFYGTIYSSKDVEGIRFIAEKAEDNAVIPYGYVANLYNDNNGTLTKVKTLTNDDFKTDSANYFAYTAAEGQCVVVEPGTMGGNDPEPYYPPYNGGYSGGSSTVSVKSVTLDKTEAKLEEGASLKLVATVLPENASDPTVTWTSSDEKVATVDENGNVKAVGVGTATITAKAGRKTVTFKLTVEAKKLPQVVFDDVAKGSWFEGPVYWAVENKITNGIGSDLFGPELDGSRAQSITFLWRAAGEPKIEGFCNAADILAGSYYEDAAKWAIANGITNGVGNNLFGSDNPITREQFVTLLYRFAKQEEKKNSELGKKIKAKEETVKIISLGGSSAFSDVEKGSYYEEAVNWAAGCGITNGIGGSLFGTGQICNRAEIVTFLYRLIN